MAAAHAAAFAFPVAPRVNLMPRAETERRAKSRLVRRWAAGLLSAVLVVAVVSVGAFWLQLAATQRLAAENARTQTLLSQLSDLSGVRVTLDLQRELTAFRQDAMANDLSWSGLIQTIGTVVPAGVSISGFTLTPGGIPEADERALEVGAEGSIFLVSPTPQDIVPLVRAVRPLPGVASADAWQVATGEAAYTYELRVVFDQSVYSGDYAAEQE